jgi:hypothetical protein
MSNGTSTVGPRTATPEVAGPEIKASVASSVPTVASSSAEISEAAGRRRRRRCLPECRTSVL